MEPRIVEQIEGIVESNGSNSGAHIEVPEAWIGQKVKVNVATAVAAEAERRAREEGQEMDIIMSEMEARKDKLNRRLMKKMRDMRDIEERMRTIDINRRNLDERIERLHLEATSR